MLGPDVAVVPNSMQPYLASIGPTAKTRLKLQFHSGTDMMLGPDVAHRKELVTRHNRRHEAGSACCAAPPPDHAALRLQLRERLVSVCDAENE